MSKKNKKKKKLSQAQLAANRNNAQLSTGPKTEEGKAVSSQNSFKHGATGMFRVLCWESHEEFMEQFQLYVMELCPKGVLEYKQVLKVVQNEWRVNRLLSAEVEVYETADSRESLWKELEKLTRYQRRIEGETREAMKELRRLRSERADGKYQALEESMFIVMWDEAGRPVLVDSSASISMNMPFYEEEGPKWRAHLDDVALANMSHPPTKDESEAVLRKGGAFISKSVSLSQQVGESQKEPEKTAPDKAGKAAQDAPSGQEQGSFCTYAYEGADQIIRKQFEAGRKWINPEDPESYADRPLNF